MAPPSHCGLIFRKPYYATGDGLLCANADAATSAFLVQQSDKGLIWEGLDARPSEESITSYRNGER
jgi:hypothetical protein